MNPLLIYGASERQLNEATLYPDLYPARVISQSHNLYRIATAEAECFAAVSGKFLEVALLPEQFPAVGDYVMADRQNDASGHAVIHHVLTRKSLFTRAAAGGAHAAQVIAANIDVAFICMSMNADFNLRRLERYLSVAYQSGANPVVVLTKADLAADVAGMERETRKIAQNTDIIVTSSFGEEASFAALLPYLAKGVTASFIGSSGVGKSTLINRLSGEERLSTAGIRADGKGRHTTTRREMISLSNGAIVIDTPGMRELGLDATDLSQSFLDIAELAKNCRFFDCAHENEPGCAVRQAIESGALDAARLESYRKLMREARYDGLSGKTLEKQKLNELFSEVGGMKKMRVYVRKTDKRKGE